MKACTEQQWLHRGTAFWASAREDSCCSMRSRNPVRQVHGRTPHLAFLLRPPFRLWFTHA